MRKMVCKLGVVLGISVCSLASVQAADQISLLNDMLSIGGENRIRAESFSDFPTANGLTGLDDTRVLLRNRLHADFHPNEYVTLFAELMDSREFGSDIISRAPVNNNFEDDLDLFLAYIDLKNIGDSPVSLRVGRQILAYGKQRLIGHFLWANTGRAFDAAKLTINLEEYGGKIDVFAAEPVNRTWGEFNDFLSNDNEIYGVYSEWNNVDYVGFLEPYYILKLNDSADDQVHTIGLRTRNTYDSGWDWEFEGAGQFGDKGGLDHTAFALHAETGYTFSDAAWTPRVALGYDFSPGDDDPTDGDSETFDNLFPTNHGHYGQMDLFSWRNSHQIEMDVNAKPIDKVQVFAEAHFIFLDDENDAWYNAGGGIVRPASPGADKYVGTEIDLRAVYKPSNWFSVEAGYSHFFAGSFVEDTGDDDDADWGYLMTTITF